MPDAVRIEGLGQLRRSLKKLGSDAPKELSKELKKLADEVVQQVKPQVPYLTGAARASYRPRAMGAGAGIAFGGAKAEYAPWLEFGGSVGRGHQPRRANSGATKRTRVKGGRYLYPTLERMRPEIEDRCAAVMLAAARRYGLETRGAA